MKQNIEDLEALLPELQQDSRLRGVLVMKNTTLFVNGYWNFPSRLHRDGSREQVSLRQFSFDFANPNIDIGEIRALLQYIITRLDENQAQVDHDYNLVPHKSIPPKQSV